MATAQLNAWLLLKNSLKICHPDFRGLLFF
jgi:hypothetical protein